MDDLHERLRQIERNPSPDLWEEITDRDVGSVPRTANQHGWRRVAIVAASLAIGLAAVAWVVVAFRSSPDTTPGTVQWQRGEIEPLGATFLYPSTWHLQPFEEQVGLAGFTGAVVSNVEGDLHHPDLGPNGATSAWDLSELEPDGVVVSIEHLDAIGVPSSPDSQFPLSLADAERLGQTRHSGDAEGLWLPFWLNGKHIGARVYIGPEASEADRRTAADIVASIRPSQMGEPPAGPAILVSSSGPSSDTALLTGTLTIQNGCLAVSTEPDSSLYVVWPAGYALDEGWLLDDSGNRIARLGDDVQMGGGVTNLAHTEPSVPGGIPSSCEVGGPDAYWFAGTPEGVFPVTPSVESEPVHIEGVPFDVCRPMSIPGKFLGGFDTLWVFERAPKQGCEGYEGFQYLGVGTSDTVAGLSNEIHDVGQNTTSLWPYAAFDIDRDGFDEIAVGIGGSESRRRASIVLFRVGLLTGPSDRVGIEEVTLSCGSICIQRDPWIDLGYHPDARFGAVCDPKGITLWAVEDAGPPILNARLWTLDGSELRATTETFQLESEATASLPDGTIELCLSPVHWPSEFPNYPVDDVAR